MKAIQVLPASEKSLLRESLRYQEAEVERTPVHVEFRCEGLPFRECGSAAGCRI